MTSSRDTSINRYKVRIQTLYCNYLYRTARNTRTSYLSSISDHIKATIHSNGIQPNRILKNIIATILRLSCTTAMIDGKKYNAVTTINNKIRKQSTIFKPHFLSIV